MKVVKGLLMLVGALAVLSLVSCVGAAGWLMSGPKETVTAADLDIGGNYSEAEKVALKSACTKVMKKSNAREAESICSCLASDAGTEMSRFERILLQSTFEGDVRRIVGVTTALASVKLDPARIREMSEGSKDRMKSFMKSCGASTFAAAG
jgi:hypothetical protein